MINRLFYKYSYIALVFAVLLFASCADDVRFSDADKKAFRQDLYVTPDNYTGVAHIFSSPKKNVFLEINQKVKFTSEYTLNETTLDPDEATNYYSSVLWEINGEKFNISSIRYAFQEPGKYICTVQTIDNYGDTLKDTLNVFVNTPSHISLTSPRDMYNQVNEFFNDTIILKWEIQGLDPWETSSCIVYGSTDKKNLWNQPLGEVDCSENVNLIGSSYEAFIESLPPDYSTTYYWGVVLQISTSEGLNELDTSGVFSFSTKIIDQNSSILQIPIVYDKMSVFDNPETLITITSANGDTILQDVSYKKTDCISEYIQPQTGVNVHLENTIQTEFRTNDYSIDIPAQTKVIADTAFFIDRTPPTIWPINQEKTANKNFKFLLLDKGSGINPYKIHIYKNTTEEMEGSYNDTLLTIPNIRDTAYTLSIKAYDKAGNISSPVYWKVHTENESQILTGPYSEREDLE